MHWLHRVPTLLTLLGLVPFAAAAQKLDEGDPPRNVGLELIERPYTIRGGSVAELDLQMRSLAPGGRSTAFPYRVGWQYNTRSLSGDFGGTRSGLCRVNDVEVVFQVAASYPTWEPTGLVTPDLEATWERFDADIQRQWLTLRDAIFAHGEKISDELMTLTGSCDSMQASAQELVRQLSDPSDEAAAAVIAAESEVLSWPPAGP